MDADDGLRDFARRWAAAELRGDTAALAGLLTDDFHAVGPRGFPLSKKRWLERYDTGELVHDSFEWQQVEFRRYGDGAVALGVQSQQSIYEGHDIDGHFRVTQYLTAHLDGVWRLAAIHLSPIAELPR